MSSQSICFPKESKLKGVQSSVSWHRYLQIRKDCHRNYDRVWQSWSAVLGSEELLLSWMVELGEKLSPCLMPPRVSSCLQSFIPLGIVLLATSLLPKSEFLEKPLRPISLKTSLCMIERRIGKNKWKEGPITIHYVDLWCLHEVCNCHLSDYVHFYFRFLSFVEHF